MNIETPERYMQGDYEINKQLELAESKLEHLKKELQDATETLANEKGRFKRYRLCNLIQRLEQKQQLIQREIKHLSYELFGRN
jgi:hypothetical protein